MSSNNKLTVLTILNVLLLIILLILLFWFKFIYNKESYINNIIVGTNKKQNLVTVL